MAIHNRITIGERYGQRVVVARAIGTAKYPRYLVRCDCGSEYVMTAGNFRAAAACRNCAPRPNKRKYGSHRTVQQSRLYSIWSGMRARCRDAINPKNRRYAGRGIQVCFEWSVSFSVFETWALEHGYRDGLTIDRIDNDGDYEPSNCEWVTRAVNSQRMSALYEKVSRETYRRVFDFPIEALFEAS